MCGVLLYYSNKLNVEEKKEQLVKSLRHRGPDSNGSFVDTETNICIAHTRLAIRDLSPLGAQPMHSQNKRYLISYNGEIYNTELLISKLNEKSIYLKGTSDTEALIEYFSAFGIEATLNTINGMFAFIIYDLKEKCIIIARDRVGIKPIYYGWTKNGFIITSELSALKHIGESDLKINQTALADFLHYSYVPTPLSIFENIYKLRQGSYLNLSIQEIKSQPQNFSAFRSPVIYWSVESAYSQSQINEFQGSYDEALNYIHDSIFNSVKRRLVADVPLGAFLSGGIDSSLIVSMMKSICGDRVKSFSIGFEEADYNEANYAKQVAKHLNIEHHIEYISWERATDLINKIASVYGEPFADSSQLPTFLLSEMTRKDVVVSLSGDGGDELFSGYDRYRRAEFLWNRIDLIPLNLRRVFQKIYKNKYTEAISSESALDFYLTLVKFWRKLPLIDLTTINRSQTYQFRPEFDYLRKINDINEVSGLLDFQTYLCGDILAKVDRASMAYGLEVRVPFLDHTNVEKILSLPKAYRLKKDKLKPKPFLQEILKRYLPLEMIDRPKKGFSVPIEKWLKSDLNEWASELLSPKSLSEHNYFNVNMISEYWIDFNNKNRGSAYEIWNILMFQKWYEEWKELISQT